MWPFSKKQSKISNLTKAAVNHIIRLQCSYPTCYCYDCPCRGKCGVEQDIHKVGGCGQVQVLVCSWKKHLKGELDNGKEKDSRGIIPTNSANGRDFFGFGEISPDGGKDG